MSTAPMALPIQSGSWGSFQFSGHELGDADPQDAEYIPREQATLPVHYRHDGAREQRADAQVVAGCGPYLRILKPATLSAVFFVHQTMYPDTMMIAVKA